MSFAEKPDLSQDDPELKDIEVIEFSSEIYPDKRRVKINFLLSDFQVNPNAAITLVNQSEEQLAEVNIVNIFSQDNEITLHIPANQNKPGDYQIALDLFYVQEEEIPGSEGQVSLKTIPLKSVSTSFTLL
jgi:hypothetical protein